MGLPSDKHKDFTIVIISGAGGTGTQMVQFAKAYGAGRIITSSSPQNFELLRSLGATDLINYHTGTIWSTLKNNSVDFVLDNHNAPGTADAAMPSLKPGGVFLRLPGGPGGSLSKHPKEGVKQINYGYTKANNYKNLDVVRALVDAGHVKPVVSATFKIEDIDKALNAALHGHLPAKVGLNVFTTADEATVVV